MGVLRANRLRGNEAVAEPCGKRFHCRGQSLRLDAP
jgi:hypothetical protein